jgi:23S rRNA pseudouridine2605 synthase
MSIKIEKIGDKNAGKPAAAPKAKKPSATKTAAAKPAKAAAANSSAAKTKTPVVKAKSSAAKTDSVKAKSSATKTPTAKTTIPVAKAKASAAKEKTPAAKTPKKKAKELEPILDPIGDVSDGEAQSSLDAESETESAAMMDAYRNETEAEADQDEEDLEDEEVPEDEEEQEKAPRPPVKLERLQKILSQAGVASRRHAEELIEQGRVMVNGKVVDKLGSKADAGRDHIRVDGKMLQGAERHRYFVLNKPKGYVTTVSDPEGRSTVMEFFAGMGERLYPVGRLDYQSEGLLLMTNDGALANQLTKAASGVEKTYLVKVAGQPTEQELEILRGGVAIEKGKPGSPKVRTAPAAVRRVRQGDNPWFEVVLIEGRNRELRKMFSAIGHFVEKIRRVGYGPLVLDQEPGKFRELDTEELKALKLTAEGKLKPKRTKTLLISEEIRPSSDRSERPIAREGRSPEGRNFERRDERRGAPMGGRPPSGRSSSGRPPARGFAGGRDLGRGGRPPFVRPQGERRPWPEGQRRSGPPGFPKPDGEQARPASPPRFDRPGFMSGPRGDSAPRFEGRKPFQPRPPFRPNTERAPFKPRTGGPSPARAGSDRPPYQRTEGANQRFDRPARPPFDRGAGPRPDRPAGPRFDKAPGTRFDRPSAPHFDKGAAGPRFDRPARPPFDRGAGARSDRPAGPRFDRGPQKSFGKPSGAGLGSKPAGRFEKSPGKSFDRKPAGNFSKGPAPSWDKGPTGPPTTPQGSGHAFRGGSTARPGGQGRPAPGGRGKPAFGGKPGGRPGGGGRTEGFVKSGYRPGGAKRSGSRPGVSKTSLKGPGGKKRG